MNRLWNNFKIAFSMFSKIPMPQADWNRENMKYMMCFFPFVGLVIGVLTILAGGLASCFSFGVSFTAMVFVAIPVLVSGGIHVDGLLDTADALSSWREREKRLEILKDSHAGAFAVITGCLYFLVWYASLSEIVFDRKAQKIVALGYILSRSLSGLGVVCFPKATEKGTVSEFSRKAENRVVRRVLFAYLALLFFLMAAVSPVYGCGAFAAALLIFLWYYKMSMHYFGGTTGDLSGCFLCVCEAGICLALAVLSKVPMGG